MGLSLNGWIEVKNPHKEEWYGIVKIGIPLLQAGRNDAMYRHFFYDQDAVVGCRGLPDILSAEVQGELPSIEKGAFSCRSWLTWDEMLLIDWDIVTGDWQLMYDMMELLSKSHGEDNVRMVIWFY